MPDGRQVGTQLRRGAVLAALWLLPVVASSARAEPEITVEAAAQDVVGISAGAGATLRTRVLRPPGVGPFPLAVVSHGSPPKAADRPAMEVPVLAPISNWLLQQGYLVALPLRRGYGQTGGPWLEAYGSCSNPDFYKAGLASAEDIQTTLGFFRQHGGIARDRMLLVGWSAGGWASIAADSQNPPGVLAVVNFAGGRGGGQPQGVKDAGSQTGNCAPERLVEAAGRYGSTARIPSVWVYAANDAFFGPVLSRRMFDAYSRAGAKAEYVALPAFGSDGHRVFTAADGRALWQPPVDKFLATVRH